MVEHTLIDIRCLPEPPSTVNDQSSFLVGSGRAEPAWGLTLQQHQSSGTKTPTKDFGLNGTITPCLVLSKLSRWQIIGYRGRRHSNWNRLTKKLEHILLYLLASPPAIRLYVSVCDHGPHFTTTSCYYLQTSP